eukprot:3979842-Prymnesium_polylepis.1
MLTFILGKMTHNEFPGDQKRTHSVQKSPPPNAGRRNTHTLSLSLGSCEFTSPPRGPHATGHAGRRGAPSGQAG